MSGQWRWPSRWRWALSGLPADGSGRDDCDSELPPDSGSPSDSLHAYEITEDDATLIRMMAGASFGPGTKMVLPSGKTITGTEMQRWLEGQRR